MLNISGKLRIGFIGLVATVVIWTTAQRVGDRPEPCIPAYEAPRVYNNPSSYIDPGVAPKPADTTVVRLEVE